MKRDTERKGSKLTGLSDAILSGIPLMAPSRANSFSRKPTLSKLKQLLQLRTSFPSSDQRQPDTTTKFDNRSNTVAMAPQKHQASVKTYVTIIGPFSALR